MWNPSFSFKENKETYLIDYLKSLGHQVQKVCCNDHWYSSLLRTERTPSFKVNRELNLWYDHGIGKGGTIIAFGTVYFNRSVTEFLQRLEARTEKPSSSSFFHQQFTAENSLHSHQKCAGEKKENTGSKITILDDCHYRMKAC